MNFAPLLNSVRDGNTLGDAEVQRCSPRSMYSLTTAVGVVYGSIVASPDRVEKLGIQKIKADALKDIQSKLTTSNVAQELFSSFAEKWVHLKIVPLAFFFSYLG